MRAHKKYYGAPEIPPILVTAGWKPARGIAMKNVSISESAILHGIIDRLKVFVKGSTIQDVPAEEWELIAQQAVQTFRSYGHAADDIAIDAALCECARQIYINKHLLAHERKSIAEAALDALIRYERGRRR